MPLTARDKEALKERAGYRCEYCRIVGWELQADHILPRSPRRYGSTDVPKEDLDSPENLAAACTPCNRFKGDFTTGRDPLSGNEFRLFHPRRDVWDEHFAWGDGYLRLLPLTAIGGATISRLRMNTSLLKRQRRLLRHAMAAGASPWP